VPATNLLADICQSKGQRALIGRVCMNTDLSPDYYRDESTEATIQKTQECIEHVRKIDPDHKLVIPIITPRFAPSCTKDCLERLGALHKETGYPAQTHLAENTNEVKLVRELFPECESYTHVYDDTGLLTSKMVLAHCVHLSNKEIDLVKARDAKISHCPASNTALTSGCAKIRKYLDTGITVGLGTDVSGGFSPSILETARQAIWVSRFVAMLDGDHAKLSVEEALYLATRGGAAVVGLQDKVGGFEVGKEWDAQMIKLDEVAPYSEGASEHDGPVDIFGWESWENKVHKWLYNGNDKNTLAVWVKGRLVHSTAAYKQ
jgi:guanine deaminase